LEEVEKLNQTEQLRLLEQIAVLIRNKTTMKNRRSILEIQGMGKDVWRNIDAQKYVNKERDSWNG
jgi:predicted transposase YdaD